jgi:hypothetical protein
VHGAWQLYIALQHQPYCYYLISSTGVWITSKYLFVGQIAVRADGVGRVPVCVSVRRIRVAPRFVATSISTPQFSNSCTAIIYRIRILPVVLYGYETWSFTLREKLGRGCSKIGCWGRYLAKEGQNNVRVEKTASWWTMWTIFLIKYYSGNQIKKNKMGGACDTYRGEEM